MRHDDSTRRGDGPQLFPFAALPHALAADPRLPSTAKVLAALILKYARHKDHAWPTIATLAKLLQRTRRTIQLNLALLKATGWFGEEAASNPTGRILVLLWRRPQAGTAPPVEPVPKPEPPILPPPLTAPLDQPEVLPAGTVPAAEPAPIPAVDFCAPPAPFLLEVPAPVVAPEETVVVEPMSNGKKNEPDLTERQRREDLCTPTALRAALAVHDDPILRAELEKRLAPPPPRPVEPLTTPELIQRLHEHPGYPPRLAHELATILNDPRSFRGYLAKVNAVLARTLPAEALLDALRQAMKPGIERPGGLFMSVLRRWELNGVG